MAEITELELQNLRHLITAHDTISKKWEDYASQCTTPEVVQFLQDGANCAKQTKQKLMGYLK